jgi:hypothetical protein
VLFVLISPFESLEREVLVRIAPRIVVLLKKEIGYHE